MGQWGNEFRIPLPHCHTAPLPHYTDHLNSELIDKNEKYE